MENFNTSQPGDFSKESPLFINFSSENEWSFQNFFQELKMPENTKPRYVTKQNTILIGLICLMIGFTIGVVFTSFKLKDSGTQAPEKNQPIDYQAREKELKTRLSANPEDVSAWTQLGHVYFDTKQHEKAIQAYLKSLSIAPDNADVLTDLGIMYRRNGQPKEAVRHFDKAILVDPEHENARFNKGIVLMHDLNQKEAALSVWEELLTINPLSMVSRDQSLDQLIEHYKEN